jgi:hypothetical protein
MQPEQFKSQSRTLLFSSCAATKEAESFQAIRPKPRLRV